MIGSIYRQRKTMSKINFYNYYHNGDLFCSRAFIKQIVDELPNFEFGYYHNNNPKTISDLVKYEGTAREYSHNERFVETDDTLAINTWIAIYYADRYPEPPYFNNGGINYVVLHQIWTHIFEKINLKFGTNLVIKSDPKDYIAVIDFEKFELANVKDYVKSDRKRILFSNGVPMSGQSFAYDFKDVVDYLAEKYKQFDFLCTNKFMTNETNVHFTSDITRIGSDLNEIGYLSRYCNLIIGKNSGPFIYCLERQNFTDPNKKFISFNHLREDSLDYGIDVDCDYTFSSTTDLREVVSIIERKILEI